MKSIGFYLLLGAAITPLLTASPAQAQLCGSWEVVSIPIPPVPDPDLGNSDFRDVAAIAPDDVWAVGKIFTGSPGYDTHTLAMHWDGTEWTIVPTPNPSTSINSLEAVAAVSSNDVWAAGLKQIFTPFAELRPLILHWDGSVWEEVEDPVLDVWGSVLWTIEVGGPNDIWFGADGTTTFHWDGSSFEHREVPSFDTGNCSGTSGCGHAVVDIAAVTPDDVWAVGGAHDGDYSFVSQIWHWDGVEWTHMPGPSIPYWQRLYGVVALASDDVWAVGDLFAEDPNDSGMLIIHWDGSEWSRVATPLFTQPGGDLYDIVAIAPDDIWAAGIYTENPPPDVGRPLTMHFDGTDWRQVMPDPDGPEGAWLRGITAAGECDLWTVGSSADEPHVQHLVAGSPADIDVTPSALEITLPLNGQTTESLLIQNLADPETGLTLDWSVTDVIPPEPPTEYTWIDSDDPDGPVFAWKDITSVGTPVTLFDDWQVQLLLPFDFWFYGDPKLVMKIGSNGYLVFEADGYGYSSLNRAIPDTQVPNDMIAMFWDDLNPTHPTNPGTVHYYHDDVANEFIVQFTDVPRNNGGLPYTFEVILRPFGEILFQYLSMQGDLTSATIGIENDDGTEGVEVVYNGPYVHDNLAVLFPVAWTDWLSENPESGSVPPQGGQSVDVLVDAAGLSEGTYSGSVVVFSNDPDESTTTIPVTLTVSSEPTANEPESGLPIQTSLDSVSPNPFATITQIHFTVGQPSAVSLEVSDILGRRVARLVDGHMEAGRHEIRFDASDLPSGVYFARLTTAVGFKQTRLLTLVK